MLSSSSFSSSLSSNAKWSKSIFSQAGFFWGTMSRGQISPTPTFCTSNSINRPDTLYLLLWKTKVISIRRDKSITKLKATSWRRQCSRRKQIRHPNAQLGVGWGVNSKLEKKMGFTLDPRKTSKWKQINLANFFPCARLHNLLENMDSVAWRVYWLWTASNSGFSHFCLPVPLDQWVSRIRCWVRSCGVLGRQARAPAAPVCPHPSPPSVPVLVFKSVQEFKWKSLDGVILAKVMPPANRWRRRHQQARGDELRRHDCLWSMGGGKPTQQLWTSFVYTVWLVSLNGLSHVSAAITIALSCDKWHPCLNWRISRRLQLTFLHYFAKFVNSNQVQSSGTLLEIMQNRSTHKIQP